MLAPFVSFLALPEETLFIVFYRLDNIHRQQLVKITVKDTQVQGVGFEPEKCQWHFEFTPNELIRIGWDAETAYTCTICIALRFGFYFLIEDMQ